MTLKLISDVPQPLRCQGVSRDVGNERALSFYFSRRPTDDELRLLHQVMQRAALCSTT
jgi:hypothetical protein